MRVFFRAECRGCGVHTCWVFSEKAAAAAMDPEKIRRVSLNSHVVCPYFHKRKQLCVYCETWDPGQKYAITEYKDIQQLTLYMQKYCRRKWESCRMARAASSEYKKDRD
jgi:hypothetical protein